MNSPVAALFSRLFWKHDINIHPRPHRYVLGSIGDSIIRSTVGSGKNSNTKVSRPIEHGKNNRGEQTVRLALRTNRPLGATALTSWQDSFWQMSVSHAQASVLSPFGDLSASFQTLQHCIWIASPRGILGKRYDRIPGHRNDE